ncbi:hypothetical protein C8Q77DRAFT_1113032 [Trametes polyzona]|nr:hypothetical protein C8Q77DRAFT_1113032 [Trametes polyzona]
MLQFVKDRAAVHRALLDEWTPPVLSPLFDERLLDEAASGNLCRTTPDRSNDDARPKLSSPIRTAEACPPTLGHAVISEGRLGCRAGFLGIVGTFMAGVIVCLDGIHSES